MSIKYEREIEIEMNNQQERRKPKINRKRKLLTTRTKLTNPKTNLINFIIP